MKKESKRKNRIPEGFAPLGNGLYADVEGLRAIRHDCVQCARAHSCCNTYEVEVTWDEIRRIDSLMPQIARRKPSLRVGPNEYRDVFRDADDDVLVIDADASQACPFLVRRSGRCAIHTAALDLGVEPYRTKPLLCAAWPLAVQPIGRGRTLLSCDVTAFQFPCTSRNRARRIRPEVYDIVRRLFGAPAADALRRHDEESKEAR